MFSVLFDVFWSITVMFSVIFGCFQYFIIFFFDDLLFFFSTFCCIRYFSVVFGTYTDLL